MADLGWLEAGEGEEEKAGALGVDDENTIINHRRTEETVTVREERKRADKGREFSRFSFYLLPARPLFLRPMREGGCSAIRPGLNEC